MVTRMLERAIEIEGLLRIIRNGNPLPETYTILSKKAVELADDAMALEEERYHRPEERGQRPEERVKKTEERAPMIMMTDVPTEMTHEDETITEKIPEIVITKAVPQIIHEVKPNDAFQEDLSEEEDDILLSLEDEETNADKPINEALNKDSLIIEQESKSKQEIPININTVNKENNKEKQEKPVFKRQTKLKSVFSLNDKFLYSRELFEGNMKMFDSTLDFIEGIEEFSIIEDYFYRELEWDPDNATVISFMEILRPHFKD